jgi:DNA-binding transcriptional LysR family regulator
MFKLYTVEQGSLPFVDYGTLMREFRGAKTVLEFGPGASTFALIEAGVEKIVTLEHLPQWFDRAVEQFKDYPQVEIRQYYDEPVALADVEEDFDMALVDSPKGFTHEVLEHLGVRKVHPGMEDCSRLNTCLFALDRAPIVYLHDAYRPLERGTLGRLNALGHRSEYIAPAKYGLARITRWPRAEQI